MSTGLALLKWENPCSEVTLLQKSNLFLKTFSENLARSARRARRWPACNMQHASPDWSSTPTDGLSAPCHPTLLPTRVFGKSCLRPIRNITSFLFWDLSNRIEAGARRWNLLGRSLLVVGRFFFSREHAPAPIFIALDGSRTTRMSPGLPTQRARRQAQVGSRVQSRVSI